MGTDSSEFSKRPKGRKKFERRNASSVKANWGIVDPNDIMGLVCALTKDGRAVRFGYSRDQGAYALGIYGDGDAPYTTYCGVGDDVDEWVRSIISSFDGDDQLRLPV